MEMLDQTAPRDIARGDGGRRHPVLLLAARRRHVRGRDPALRERIPLNTRPCRQPVRCEGPCICRWREHAGDPADERGVGERSIPALPRPLRRRVAADGAGRKPPRAEEIPSGVRLSRCVLLECERHGKTPARGFSRGDGRLSRGETYPCPLAPDRRRMDGQRQRTAQRARSRTPRASRAGSNRWYASCGNGSGFRM